jgi:orotate phosphoribosyltransferase
MVSDDQILQEFRDAGALLEGHFILTSGFHSGAYLQCARVLMDARRAARLCEALAAKLRSSGLIDGIDMVVSPAMGGVVVGYEMGRQRGFEIEPGLRCLMVEDVVTTGLSSRECIAVIHSLGGQVQAATALVDRSGGRADLPVPFLPLITLDIPHFAPDQLPAFLANIPPVKPGSRGLKA